jgi:hypothetical protein
MTAAGKSPLTPVIGEGGRCAGFLLRRRGEIEAFTVDEVSIGSFTAVLDAVEAVLDKAGAKR